MDSTVFETSRLHIRPLQMDDLPAFHAMQGNERVMRYTTGRGMSREENARDLKRVIDYYGRPDNDFWVWAVVQKSDRAFIGTCALIVNEDKEHELGFRFLEQFWGQGYGTEVARGLIEYAFRRTEVDALVAYVNEENKGSVRVLERSQLLFERSFFNEEEQCTDRVYRCTRSAFLHNR